tara:strand:+ start:347 stop:451 length:105 start_codon:yes stop_codon:yes gene_type:complete
MGSDEMSIHNEIAIWREHLKQCRKEEEKNERIQE